VLRRAVVLCLPLLVSSCCIRSSARNDRFVTLAAKPFVMVDGAPSDLKPGYGVELAYEATTMPEDDILGLGFRQWIAWSHHEGEPGWPDAEYLRIGMSMSLSASYPSTLLPSEHYIGVSLGLGPSLHYIRTDGPGDVGGIGLRLEPEVKAVLGGRFEISLGCELDGWVHFRGGVAGTFATNARIGFRF